MTVDKPQAPGAQAEPLPRPRSDNVYAFPSGNKLADAASPQGSGEDRVLRDLEDALCNWF